METVEVKFKKGKRKVLVLVCWHGDKINQFIKARRQKTGKEKGVS